jgi:hypothetical protein
MSLDLWSYPDRFLTLTSIQLEIKKSENKLTVGVSTILVAMMKASITIYENEDI